MSEPVTIDDARAMKRMGMRMLDNEKDPTERKLKIWTASLKENGPWRLEKLAALIEQNSACRLKAVGKGDSAAV